MALITENKYHKILPSFIVQPRSTKSRLTVEISPFFGDPLEAPVLQDLFRSTDFQKKYWCQVTKYTYHIFLILFTLSVFRTQTYVQCCHFREFIVFPIQCLLIIHLQYLS